VGRDPDSDLAVIKIDAGKVDLQPVTVADSTQVKPGQFVVAIGNPFGLANSMSFGIVSALGRTLPASGETSAMMTAPSYTIPDIIQTDAPVNPGNSGGVLLDLAGNLVGVPTAIESPVRGSAGVGFAVPSAIVQQVVPELIAKGRFEHPYIGISGGTITSEIAKAMDLPETQRGALVGNVTKGSPAEQGNIQATDIITKINKDPVKTTSDYLEILRQYPPKAQLSLALFRKGEKFSANITTEEFPLEKAREIALHLLGIEVDEISASSRDKRARPEPQGLVIAEVRPKSRTEQAGIRRGDVILQVNETTVHSLQDFRKAMANVYQGHNVLLLIQRGHYGYYLTIPLDL